MLLQLMDAIHRPALELLLAGQPDHPIAAAVLAMYELVPLDEHTQVEEALDEVRPYIESHGGGLELLDVEGGIVHVRLSGSCQGCAASAMTLRRGVEAKLRERIQWFEEIVAHEPEPEAPVATARRAADGPDRPAGAAPAEAGGDAAADRAAQAAGVRRRRRLAELAAGR